MTLSSDENAGAIIIAGGDSKRLGYPKPLLKLDKNTIIEVMIENFTNYFREIIIVSDSKDFFSGLSVKITGDLVTGGKKSSLRGIHAGLTVSSCRDNFVIACDMPFFNMELIKYMRQFTPCYRAVVPRIGTYAQPLYAYYRKDCLPVIEKNLLNGRLKISGLYPELDVKYIEEEEIARHDRSGRAFFNINTPEDYDEARRLMLEGEIFKQHPVNKKVSK